MTFTNEEILQYFDLVVEGILVLIQKQITTIQAQTGSLQIRNESFSMECSNIEDWIDHVIN